ncbi:aminoacyl-histidine dipeptidase [Pararhodospirillum oryzae]|uniref:Cytosol non-specific dipeptidase n=1 Tax=Pararhodospirillum oryzae TaxID=478448 RepID=A0A512H634_9PROT|nr:aminoacyl-histidine dipeptidase [Pararhodospirillum oryzae]GEO80888.1 aminoacyl-histidine dipeptidase [Pararhodospirillum oryzae]
MSVFEGLSPEPVWRHFATLCALPRPSGHEEAVRDALATWARERALAVEKDGVGNLLIRKPASPGREGHPGVILQGHLDMVAEARAGSSHDFLRDPIQPSLDDGWLVARDTTLGADNGLGVALALAVLEAPDAKHPPLEVLLTVDEERGMTGAQGLAPGWLKGTRLLNLDTEGWGEFYLGCAGGVDVNVTRAFTLRPAPAGHTGARITVGGLAGGHSGCDIALGRGNANKILVGVLQTLAEHGARLGGQLAGGSARNAIPRDAWATVSLPPGLEEGLDTLLGTAQERLRALLPPEDAGLGLSATPADVETVMDPIDQETLLAVLAAAPCGVHAMSPAFAGVVETSNNLGVLRLENGAFRANLLARSLIDAQTRRLADTLTEVFHAAGFTATAAGFYPGWTPNPASPLLATCRAVYARAFQAEAGLQVIHAGLECGLIAARYPSLDMISFGPTIQGAHAPGERVDVASVGHAWRLLRALLAAL